MNLLKHTEAVKLLPSWQPRLLMEHVEAVVLTDERCTGDEAFGPAQTNTEKLLSAIEILREVADDYADVKILGKLIEAAASIQHAQGLVIQADHEHDLEADEFARQASKEQDQQ